MVSSVVIKWKFISRELFSIPASSGIMDEYLTYQMNEYRPSSQLTHLESTLNEFCNEAYNDRLECGADSLEPILKTYRAKDWSDKFLSKTSLWYLSRILFYDWFH